MQGDPRVERDSTLVGYTSTTDLEATGSVTAGGAVEAEAVHATSDVRGNTHLTDSVVYPGTSSLKVLDIPEKSTWLVVVGMRTYGNDNQGLPDDRGGLFVVQRHGGSDELRCSITRVSGEDGTGDNGSLSCVVDSGVPSGLKLMWDDGGGTPASTIHWMRIGA